MYFDDHAPPHFHAAYGGEEAVVGIEALAVLHGSPSARPGLVPPLTPPNGNGTSWAADATCGFRAATSADGRLGGVTTVNPAVTRPVAR